MKVKQLTLAALSVLFISLSFIACKKDSDKQSSSDNTSDIEIAQNESLGESSFNDVTVMTDQAIVTGAVAYRVDGTEGTDGLLGNPCATVSVDTVSALRKITIDFGSANCMCNDGRNRRGKVIATWNGGRYRDSNTVVSLSFDNYFVNDNQIKGTKTVTNKGHNAAGHLVYAVEVNGQIIKANNGGTITWVSSRQREWLTGENTLNPLDDSYAITGSASGTTAAGGSYTITIKQALVCKLTCRWFESGILELKPTGQATRTLDYGSTGCDANATLTIFGINIPVVLP
jgi:hypothetical protein